MLKIPVLTARTFLVLSGLAVVLASAAGAFLVAGVIVGAMGDDAGRQVLGWIAFGTAILLGIDLFCLVLALGLRAAVETERPTEEERGYWGSDKPCREGDRREAR